MGTKVEFDGQELAQKFKEEVLRKAKSENHQIECPFCQKTISVPVGESLCPECGRKITLELTD